MVTDNFFKEEDNGSNEIDFLDLTKEMNDVNQVNDKLPETDTAKKTKTRAKKEQKTSSPVSKDDIRELHVLMPKSLINKMKLFASVNQESMSRFLYNCIIDGMRKFANEKKCIDLIAYVEEEVK